MTRSRKTISKAPKITTRKLKEQTQEVSKKTITENLSSKFLHCVK